MSQVYWKIYADVGSGAKNSTRDAVFVWLSLFFLALLEYFPSSPFLSLNRSSVTVHMRMNHPYRSAENQFRNVAYKLIRRTAAASRRNMNSVFCVLKWKKNKNVFVIKISGRDMTQGRFLLRSKWCLWVFLPRKAFAVMWTDNSTPALE